MEGKNVLYITMEMAEEKIAERIDANLLNVTMDELETLPKMMYDKKIAKLRERTAGKLIVKEFPTASAHAGHFRHLVNELNKCFDDIELLVHFIEATMEYTKELERDHRRKDKKANSQ